MHSFGRDNAYEEAPVTPPVTHNTDSDARGAGRASTNTTTPGRHHVVNIIDVMTEGAATKRRASDGQPDLASYLNSMQFKAVCPHRRSS